MIDQELERLAACAPDRALSSLESDIWMRLSARERAAHTSRRLLLAQAAILLIALAGSLFVGRALARRQPPDSLAAFSDPLPLLPLLPGAMAQSPP